jgi:hypothetical protein
VITGLFACLPDPVLRVRALAMAALLQLISEANPEQLIPEQGRLLGALVPLVRVQHPPNIHFV